MALILVNTIGIIGFMAIDDYPFLDAVYQTVFTLTTVGYQETHPISQMGRLFVTFLIIGGVLVWSYALGVTISVVVNDDLIGKIREALMESHVKKHRDHFIVAGYTTISRQVVRQFRRQEIPFVILEDDGERLLNLDEEHAQDVLPLNPFLTESYRRANVAQARGIISTFKGDADNITVVVTGKILEEELNRQLLVIGVASNNEARLKLKKVGADLVILPDELIGQRIGAMALHPPDVEHRSFLDRVAFGEFINLDIREVTVKKGSMLDGVSIRDSNIRAVIGAHILGIRRRHGRRFLMMPNPDIVIHAQDTVLVMGTLAQLEGLPGYLHPELQGHLPGEGHHYALSHPQPDEELAEESAGGGTPDTNSQSDASQGGQDAARQDNQYGEEPKTQPTQ